MPRILLLLLVVTGCGLSPSKNSDDRAPALNPTPTVSKDDQTKNGGGNSSTPGSPVIAGPVSNVPNQGGNLNLLSVTKPDKCQHVESQETDPRLIDAPIANGGQLFVSLKEIATADGFVGYVVGNQTTLIASLTECLNVIMDRVPPGKMDIVITGKCQSSAGLTDCGRRLNGVEFLPGRRTMINNISMAPLRKITVPLKGIVGTATAEIKGTDLVSNLVAGQSQIVIERVPEGDHEIDVAASGSYLEAFHKFPVAGGDATLPPVYLYPTSGIDRFVRLSNFEGASGNVVSSKEAHITIVDPNVTRMKIADDASFTTGRGWEPFRSTLIVPLTNKKRESKTIWIRLAGDNDVGQYDQAITLDLSREVRNGVKFTPEFSVPAYGYPYQGFDIALHPSAPVKDIKYQVSAGFISTPVMNQDWQAVAPSLHLPLVPSRGSSHYTLTVTYRDEDGYESLPVPVGFDVGLPPWSRSTFSYSARNYSCSARPNTRLSPDPSYLDLDYEISGFSLPSGMRDADVATISFNAPVISYDILLSSNRRHDSSVYGSGGGTTYSRSGSIRFRATYQIENHICGVFGCPDFDCGSFSNMEYRHSGAMIDRYGFSISAR